MRRLGLIALLLIAALGAAAGWLDSQISRPYRGHRPEKVFVDVPHAVSYTHLAAREVQSAERHSEPLSTARPSTACSYSPLEA